MSIKQLKNVGRVMGLMLLYLCCFLIFGFYSCFQWNNLKNTIAGAGPDGNIQTDYHPFTNKDISHHIGIYIFNGLATSLRVEQRFKLQRINKLHCNNFMYGTFVTKTQRHHNHLECFLHARTRLLKFHPVSSTLTEIWDHQSAGWMTFTLV